MFNWVRKIDWDYFHKSNKILWLLGAYLTWKHVDKYQVFPAIHYNGFIKLNIYKAKSARLILKGPIKLEQWLNKKSISTITLNQLAVLQCDNEFTIGNNVSIFLSNGAYLYLGGKKNESGSGITADSTVMVQKKIRIESDCMVAWDTFITDSDWHNYSKHGSQGDTVIGEHTWLGIGVKILKGVYIENNSIVTTNSVVNSGRYPEKSLLSGIPAKIVKKDISTWKR